MTKQDFKISVEAAIEEIEKSKLTLENLMEICLENDFAPSSFPLSIAISDLVHASKSARNFLKSLK